MMRLGIALSVLLSASSVQSFQTQRMGGKVNQILESQQTRVSIKRGISTSHPEYGDPSLSDALNSVTNAARDQIASGFSDYPDADEAEISQRKEMVERRMKTYKVQLPLASVQLERVPYKLTLGMSLMQINKGRIFENKCLNVDTLEFVSNMESDEEKYDLLDQESVSRRIDGEYQGTVVSSVLKGGAAWTAGVRAGDLLQTTSATMGSQMWPKSTLEGVRSAIQSRRASSASSIELEFQSEGDALDNRFDLSLSKPIGMRLKGKNDVDRINKEQGIGQTMNLTLCLKCVETDDGYVEVAGFTENAPTLVRCAVMVGDRVVAVDSSFGGKMWPVSTVEGVVSAVTARLPGQEITFRFERPEKNMDAASNNIMQSITMTQKEAERTNVSKVDNKELLQRCRGILKKYKNTEGKKSTFVGKYDVPGLIADKVLDALSSEEAKVDAVTLSMIMSAYLSCEQAAKAIDAFEAATGFSAKGCNREPTVTVSSEVGNQIVPNPEALDIFTVSALLKAHAIIGDLDSVERVFAATEGKAGSIVGGLEVSSWPGTGVDGSLQPDTRCYNIALSAAAKSKAEFGLEFALNIFDEMTEPNQKKSSKQKDLVSYNTILNALTSRQRYQEAVTMFYKMKTVGIKPDKFSYTSLAKAVVSDIDVEGDIEEVIYDMREEGVAPDIVTFNTAIRSLCSQRRISAAKKMVAMMEDCDILPDSMTYGYLMKGLIDSGNPSAALTLFETACTERQTVALTENKYLYTTAISATASLGDHERALELLTRMSSIGVQPNLKTMTAVMGACLSSGNPELAADIFNKINNPDGYALNKGLEALCKSGEASKALAIISNNQGGRGLLKGKHLMNSFKTIISVSLERDDYQMARDAFAALIRAGNRPSRAIFEACFRAMKLFPKKRRAFQVVGEMDEFATAKFRFLLFMLDSLAGRKLPCEGHIYTAILNYGYTIGGLPKKISTLLVSARADFSNDEKLINGGDKDESVPFFASWEALFLRYNEMKGRIASDGLPRLFVRVSSRDTRTVLNAERNLSYKRSQLI